LNLSHHDYLIKNPDRFVKLLNTFFASALNHYIQLLYIIWQVENCKSVGIFNIFHGQDHAKI